MKLRIGKRAQQQADRIEAWWVEHRQEAPDLFIDELETTHRELEASVSEMKSGQLIDADDVLAELRTMR